MVRSTLVVLAMLACCAVADHAGAVAPGDRDVSRASAAAFAPGLPMSVVDGACEEGSVMLYTLVFRGNLDALVRDFRARFPCLSVQLFTGSGGVLAQRFTSEARGGSRVADVWMNSSPIFGDRLADQGLLLDWTPPDATNMPDEWKREGAWYAIGLAHIGVVWNTQEIDPEQKAWLDRLRTWDQLPGAPFVGTSSLVDIRAGGTTQLAYYFFDKQYGQAFLPAIAKMQPTVFDAINPLIERLSAGEFVFGMTVTADTAAATQWLNGAPLQWRYPEPGLAVPYFIAVAANAPHPNAAKLLLTWSLSRDGQSSWVNATGLAPASPGVDDRRPYAREPWYSLPKHYYRADWKAIASSLKDEVARFTASFGY